jgi:hypothetical protein
MSEYYSLKQAMDLLGLYSVNGFHQLTRKHPDAFVIVETVKGKQPLYDKDKIDEFAKTFIHKKQVKK